MTDEKIVLGNFEKIIAAASGRHVEGITQNAVRIDGMTSLGVAYDHTTGDVGEPADKGHRSVVCMEYRLAAPCGSFALEEGHDGSVSVRRPAGVDASFGEMPFDYVMELTVEALNR